MNAATSIAAYLMEGVDRGSVRQTQFLSALESAAVLKALAGRACSARAYGGYPGASRRVVIAAPESVSNVTPKVALWTVAPVTDPSDLQAALIGLGIDEEHLGDCAALHDVTVIAVGGEVGTSPPDSLVIRGESVRLEIAETLEQRLGATQRMERVLASTRTDAIGAAAFGVSRTWFSKGAAAGKVFVDGHPASKSTQLEIGSELYAEGLGRVTLRGLLGTTKRGNQRAVLDVERRKAA